MITVPRVKTAFGGTAPLVATALIRDLQTPMAPALVVVVCGIVTFAGTFAVARRCGRVLGGPDRSSCAAGDGAGGVTRLRGNLVVLVGVNDVDESEHVVVQ